MIDELQKEVQNYKIESAQNKVELDAYKTKLAGLGGRPGPGPSETDFFLCGRSQPWPRRFRRRTGSASAA